MYYETMRNIVKISVFCLSSLRNEVKKLFYVQFFTNLIYFFLFDFNITKMHIICSFFKTRLLLFQTKNDLYWQPILKKLIRLRFWSDGAGFKTEAQKFFNARTMHTA